MLLYSYHVQAAAEAVQPSLILMSDNIYIYIYNYAYLCALMYTNTYTVLHLL